MHLLLSPSSVGICHGMICIAEKRETQSVLIVELPLTVGLVGTDSRVARPRLSISSDESLILHACVVQPGVSAFG